MPQFSAIVQYIYSDNFFIMSNNLQYFVMLMICADYFLLPRLAKLAGDNILNLAKPKNVIYLLILARHYN